MSKESRNFVIILSIAALVLIGVIAQNVATALNPKTAELHIDVDKVRKEIQAAGLTPREALHWKEL